jgi:hypothetical protein
MEEVSHGKEKFTQISKKLSYVQPFAFLLVIQLNMNLSNLKGVLPNGNFLFGGDIYFFGKIFPFFGNVFNICLKTRYYPSLYFSKFK